MTMAAIPNLIFFMFYILGSNQNICSDVIPDTKETYSQKLLWSLGGKIYQNLSVAHSLVGITEMVSSKETCEYLVASVHMKKKSAFFFSSKV